MGIRMLLIGPKWRKREPLSCGMSLFTVGRDANLAVTQFIWLITYLGWFSRYTQLGTLVPSRLDVCAIAHTQKRQSYKTVSPFFNQGYISTYKILAILLMLALFSKRYFIIFLHSEPMNMLFDYSFINHRS